MAALTAVMSAFEALLFAVLGPHRRLARRQVPGALVGAARQHADVAGRGAGREHRGGALQTIVKHQTLAVNLPMRLRWNFHRLMLGQSMAFYQDEFAGRITAKVMQTALAVRETIFVLADVLVAMGVYVATMIILAGVLDGQLMLALRGLAGAVHRTMLLLRAAPGQASARRRPMRARS
jgi:ATP-binding cassette subfamily B multidrug efflux pump